MEKFESGPAMDAQSERVNKLRERSLESLPANDLFSQEVVMAHKQLCADLKEDFGRENVWRGVAAWHYLIGSTPEPENVITEEERAFVEERLDEVLEDLTSKLDALE